MLHVTVRTVRHADDVNYSQVFVTQEFSPHLPAQRQLHLIRSRFWSASLSQETKIYSEQRMINQRSMTAREEQRLAHVCLEQSLPLPWQLFPQTPARRRGRGWVAR